MEPLTNISRNAHMSSHLSLIPGMLTVGPFADIVKNQAILLSSVKADQGPRQL